MSNYLMNLSDFFNFDEQTVKEIANLGKHLIDDCCKSLKLNEQDKCFNLDCGFGADEKITEVNENGLYELKIKTEGFLPEEIKIIVDRKNRTVTLYAKHEESVEEEKHSSWSSSETTIKRTIPDNVDVYSLEKTIENGVVSINGHDIEEDNHRENIVKL